MAEKSTFNVGDMISGRSLVGDTIHKLGLENDNVWAMTSDIGVSLANFKNDIPERYIDTGIAEQGAIGIAAGLALEGNIPFIMGMCNFMVCRAWEQIRVALCYHDLPVRMIGHYAGVTSGGGSTHYAVEDIAIMKSLVNMTVISVSDPFMIPDILEQSMTYPHPIFLRLAAGKKDTVLYERGDSKCEIGKGIQAKEGKDATIIAHGEMVLQALETAEELASQGMSIRVIDMYSIKPIDKKLILKSVKETENIVVLEDHLAEGGLASSVSDVFTDAGVYPKKFKRLGLPQVYPGFGSAEELRGRYGYNKCATINAVKDMLGQGETRQMIVD